MTIAMVNREEQIEAEIKALKVERETLRRNHYWHCPQCKRQTKIKSLEIVSFYYYNCEDWYVCDLYEIQCPKCHKSSSGYKHHKAWVKVHKLLYFFKKIIKKDSQSGKIV